MPTRYDPAPECAVRMLNELIHEYRPDLEKNGVRIRLLFAFAEGRTVFPLKHRSAIVAGWCQVHPYGDRVRGTADATICVDGDSWGKWSTQRQRALLHHEMLHIAKCSGEVDPLGRPVLAVNRGDWNHDGFFEVVKLYGSDSFEYSNLHRIGQECRQADLPFADPPTGGNAPGEPPEFEQDAA